MFTAFLVVAVICFDGQGYVPDLSEPKPVCFFKISFVGLWMYRDLSCYRGVRQTAGELVARVFRHHGLSVHARCQGQSSAEERRDVVRHAPLHRHTIRLSWFCFEIWSEFDLKLLWLLEMVWICQKKSICLRLGYFAPRALCLPACQWRQHFKAAGYVRLTILFEKHSPRRPFTIRSLVRGNRKTEITCTNLASISRLLPPKVHYWRS